MQVALRFPGSVGTLPRCMVSETFALEKRPPSRRFPALCDSQYAGGWQRYLPWRKEKHPERLCFQASNWQQVFRFSDINHRPALRASIPESGLCVSLHVLSLANTFVGQSNTVHEESGCKSVFEEDGCHTGVTWSRSSCTSNKP